MIEEEPVNRDAHFVRKAVPLLRLRLGLGDPVLQLRLAHDAVAVQLIAAADQSVVRPLGVVLEQVEPNWIVAAFETGSAEVVRVHTRTKPVALFCFEYCQEDASARVRRTE